MTPKHARMHKRALALRDRAIALARDIEAEFGKEDDLTIFARNAYCELHEVAKTIEGERYVRQRKAIPKV